VIHPLTALALIAVLGQAPAESPSDCTAEIARAIESFQPIEKPAEHTLDGLTVILHPLTARAVASPDASTIEPARMTAADLHHWVRNAGGRPFFTAPDASGTTVMGSRSPDARAVIAWVRPHIVLQILSRPSGPITVRPATPDDLPMALAASIADALAGAAGVPVPPAHDWDVPAVVTIVVRSPPTDEPRPAQLRACLGVAQRIQHGLVAFATEHRDALLAAHAEHWPATRPATAEAPAFFRPRYTTQQRIERAARRIWSEGDLPTDRAQWFADLFAQTALSDRTLVYFQPEIAVENDAVVIRGATSVPELREAIETALNTVNVTVARNEMRRLPDDGALGACRLGACRVPSARTYNRPSELAGVQTQLMYGEPLFLLDKQDGFTLVQGGDGYWGWVRDEAVYPMTDDAFDAYVSRPQAVLRTATWVDDQRVLPGTGLPIGDESDSSMTLMGPAGQRLRVARDQVRVGNNSDECSPGVRFALDLLYTPYVFGGRAPAGLDCSGLVCIAAEQAGRSLARDAAQQALAGRLVATNWHRDDIRAGDLLYFINARGKIYHTGIALSPTHLIHAAPPCVQISSLRKGDPLYDPRLDSDFLMAKRP
jgi:hypothetical protein